MHLSILLVIVVGLLCWWNWPRITGIVTRIDLTREKQYRKIAKLDKKNGKGSKKK